MLLENEIKTVIVLGAPKCGTTFLAELFDGSSNFTVIRSVTGFIECDLNIYNENDFKYKFAKTPRWILDLNDIDSIVNLFERNINSVLFCVCIREYNEHLMSYYNQRKWEYPFIYGSVSFDDFINCRALESKRNTYADNILNLRNNILHLISRIEETDHLKLMIIDMDTIANFNIVTIFRSFGVCVENSNYIFRKFVSKTTVNYDKNNKFHQAYLVLKDDERIKKYLI